MVLADPIAHADRQPEETLAMTTTHRISTGVLVALALATTAAPASAGTFDLNANGSYVPSGSPSMRSQATKPSHSLNIPPPVVRITAGNSGFDWGDAGIGAAGGLALSIVGLGGALAVSQRRNRRTATPQS
jgi:hypothetical protein